MTDIKLVASRDFYPAENPRELIVLLHRYNHTNEAMQRVAEVVRKELPHADILAPTLPVGLLSWADPQRIAEGIVDEISKLQRISEYTGIILVGHSMGAVLARKVWALAHGAQPDATVRPGAARGWADKIDRIILLAALNRGWTVSSALQPLDRLQWAAGMLWGNFCRYCLGKEALILNFRRGAPFLTVVRLQCLAVERQLAKRPITVQLLGTDDDYIAPTDNLDIATGNNFYYVEVAHADHAGIVELAGGNDPDASEARFCLALTGDAEALKAKSLAPSDVFDGCDEIDDFDATTALPKENLEVMHVVFVIHGIRDRGFWTRRIARWIKSAANRKGEPCRAITSTYGFFPMGPFLLPWVRRGKVEWLLDQYVTARFLYPKATFSYVGHSNGTYLLAKALELCPALEFKGGVVFAGSMVRRSFEWSRYVPDRVSRVLNYVATADWVVAIFPYGLERMRLPDIGGAGHAGFAEDKFVTNVRYAQGAHSAALVPGKWQEMADFVLGGDAPADPVPRIEPDPRNLRRGQYAPAYWLVIVGAVLGIAALMLAILYKLGGPWAPVWALIFWAYIYVVKVVLTRA